MPAVSPDLIPARIPNLIAGAETPAAGGEWFEKPNPHDGSLLCRGARSGEADVRAAVAAARAAQPAWAALPGVRRGEILYDLADRLRARREDMARVVAAETGKGFRAALGETDGAIALGRFFAGEGQRLYARTTTSANPHREALTVREPCGVAGLIIAANTPIANAAWKVFPALICGNAAVLKAAEDTPVSAWLLGRLAAEVGVLPGALNVVQGLGAEAGAPLAAHPGVDVVSFTGSTAVGRRIAATVGERLGKVSLELGGKNPLVVCEDADLEDAAKWVLLSAFSNAGQRCAAGSRVLVFAAVYDRFREMLVQRTATLRVGPTDDDDLGPVINARQLGNMLAALERAREAGARVLTGGFRLEDPDHAGGFYLAPTLVEGAAPADAISVTELFGPIACLYRVRDFAEAVALANDSPYGLTACIHTRDFHRALSFVRQVRAGVVVVNAGTFGSEPHMPFGGVGQSGNGWREPGTEALDVYSELKDVYLAVDPARV